MRRAVLLLLLASCARGNVPLRLTPAGETKADDYEEVLERWTKKEEVYEGLDSKLFVWATFHSPEFRRAFLLRHTDVYGPGSEEAARLLITSPEAEEQLEFFFSAATTSPRWNDFERKDSIWRVTLEGDDAERVEGTVQRLKVTANLRAIYPYMTDFSRPYAVRFPRTHAGGRPVISAATREFTLSFRSALGTARLTWTLEPTASDAGEGARPPPEPPPSPAVLDDDE